jgi:threonine/homoserine/homoserine lactone efflux protein
MRKGRMIEEPSAVETTSRPDPGGTLAVGAAGSLLVLVTFTTPLVSPSAAFPVAAQLLVLGLVHTVNCLVIYGAVGLGAGSLGEFLKRRLRFARMFRWLSGSVLITLGLRMAFPGQR